MGEIKYSKHDYDTKMGYLNYMQGYTIANTEKISEPETASAEGLTELLEIYKKLWELIGTYTETLGNTVQSLKNAGDYIYENDKNISNGMEFLK